LDSRFDGYDELASTPWGWVEAARRLILSANVLLRDAGPITPDRSADAVSRAFGLHVVARMLRGMAVEVLLKALWSAAGQALVVQGRVQRIGDARDHDLVALARAVCGKHGRAVSADEEVMLGLLRDAITEGRYPIPKSIGVTELPGTSTEIVVFREQVFRAFLKDLLVLLGVNYDPEREP